MKDAAVIVCASAPTVNASTGTTGAGRRHAAPPCTDVPSGTRGWKAYIDGVPRQRIQ